MPPFDLALKLIISGFFLGIGWCAAFDLYRAFIALIERAYVWIADRGRTRVRRSNGSSGRQPSCHL
jgi:hypothetical protein